MKIEKSYIRKYWFGADNESELADIVLLMERDRLDQYRAALDMTFNHFEGVFKGLTGQLGPYRISVIYSIGPAHIADCVNFLAYGFPIKRIFSTGSIGGLLAGMGDIVISNRCATQDGFSRIVLPENIKKDPQLGEFVEISLPSTKEFDISDKTRNQIEKRFGCQMPTGKLFTLPAVSIEDHDRMKSIKERGFIAVDLETGPFLTACYKNKIEGICIHWITDLPLERSFYYRYYGDPKIIKADWDKKHKQWLNMPKLILPIILDILNKEW